MVRFFSLLLHSLKIKNKKKEYLQHEIAQNYNWMNNQRD